MRRMLTAPDHGGANLQPHGALLACLQRHIAGGHVAQHHRVGAVVTQVVQRFAALKRAAYCLAAHKGLFALHHLLRHLPVDRQKFSVAKVAHVCFCIFHFFKNKCVFR